MNKWRKRKKPTKHATHLCALLMISMLSPSMMACAKAQSTPINHLYVPIASLPVVRECTLPPEPVIDSQGDLLLAYVNALHAFAKCKAENERVASILGELIRGQ